jgi:hypothetical protein
MILKNPAHKFCAYYTTFQATYARIKKPLPLSGYRVDDIGWRLGRELDGFSGERMRE